MKKNKLFIFISSFLFLLTSCGGVAPKGDPVVTFEGLGGTLVSGPETVSVPSGTLWSDISKPYFTRNDTVSLFFTLVQDNIAYTVPNTFPVCADLTVFAYYSVYYSAWNHHTKRGACTIYTYRSGDCKT